MRVARFLATALVTVGCADGDRGDDAAVGGSAVATVASQPPPTSAPISAPISAHASAPTVTPTSAPVVPSGFGTIGAVVHAADGEECAVCLWLADDDASRGRGLMFVTDLGGLDGMAFRYAGPNTTSFTMRNTLLPLSIAFFGAGGALLDAFEMDPCSAEPCPSYPTPSGFVVAVEVPRGGLAAIGIGPGSTFELLADGCSPGTPASSPPTG